MKIRQGDLFEKYYTSLKTWVIDMYPGIDYDDFLKFYYENIDNFPHKYPIVEGAKEIISKLNEKGIITGILTSRDSRLIDRRLNDAGLSRDNFSFIITSDHTKVRKPDPKVFDFVDIHAGSIPASVFTLQRAPGSSGIRLSCDPGRFLLGSSGLHPMADPRERGLEFSGP